ncbi:hypothetical protein ACWGI8_42910, partial [Streptomyces sp. NPDC054841]
VAGLHGHRGAGADPGAGDLPLGQDAQQDHQLLLPDTPRIRKASPQRATTRFAHPENQIA